MNDETTETPTEATEAPQDTAEDTAANEDAGKIAELQKKIDELNGRHGSSLQKLAEYERKEKERVQKELEEKGEYEKVIEEKERELKEARERAERYDELEKAEAAELEEVLKELSDDDRELIENSNFSVFEKKKRAIAKREKAARSNSPASDAPQPKAGRDTLEYFKSIKDDKKAQVALSLSNEAAFKAFLEARSKGKLN